MTIRWWAVAVIVVLLGAAGGLLLGGRASRGKARHGEPRAPADPFAAIRWDDTPIDWRRALPQAIPSVQAGYVGSASCVHCHKGFTDSYSRHAMAKTGLRPLGSLDRAWLDRIFDTGAGTVIAHESSGYSYRPVRQGNRYFIEEQMLATDGTRLHTWLQPVTLSLSAASYGLAFAFRQGSRIYQVPIDYYPKLGRWGLDPGFLGDNYRFSRTINGFCISCHSDYPTHVASNESLLLDPLPPGVGCERCHGPGERHAKSMRAQDIVNPAHLPARRQLDVCSQCHLQGIAEQRADRGNFSYRPGEPLGTFRVCYVAETADPNSLALLAHSERLVRSACWRASRDKMTCTSCHDPHRSSTEQPEAYWKKKCLACHQDRGCTAGKGARCISCHMRRVASSDVPLVTITDHWIQRSAKPQAPIPQDKMVSWSELIGDHVAGDDLAAVEGSAAVNAAFTNGTTPLPAFGRVAAGVARWPHVPEAYLAMAMALRGPLRQPWNAARAYAAVLRFDPDQRDALLGYGQTLLDAPPGAEVEAAAAFDRLVALDPQDPDALEGRGLLLLRGGRVTEARTVFERAIVAGPMTVRARVALGALALQAKDAAGAIPHLVAARRIEPRDGWILARLAAAYTAVGDAVKARETQLIRDKLAFPPESEGLTFASSWLPPELR